VLWPLLNCVKAILKVPPTLASRWKTLHKKPFGGSQRLSASAIEEGFVNQLGLRFEHAMETDGVGVHEFGERGFRQRFLD
jgi:hypothetical protein